MSLNGIDISSYQSGIEMSVVPADFVISKASEGGSWRDPSFSRHIGQTLQLGKLAGAYHYVTGVGVEAEAALFAAQARPYLGRTALFLDWESGGNRAWGALSYLAALMDAVKARTGVMPAVYCPGGVYAQVRKAVGSRCSVFWVAAYADANMTGYQAAPWAESRYPCFIRQYSGTGRLSGYGGALDLNKCYGTAAQWRALYGGANQTSAADRIKKEGEDDMHCIVQINDEPGLTYYDGVNLHPLQHPDEAKALDMVAQQTLGHPLPRFKLGSNKAPWGTRFRAAIARK